MDFENHNDGTFKANLIKLHVLVPIRLNRKLKIVSKPLAIYLMFLYELYMWDRVKK